DEAAALYRRVLRTPAVSPVSNRPDVSAVSFPHHLGGTSCPSDVPTPCTAHDFRSWQRDCVDLLSDPLGSGSRGDSNFDDGCVAGTRGQYCRADHSRMGLERRTPYASGAIEHMAGHRRTPSAGES